MPTIDDECLHRHTAAVPQPAVQTMAWLRHKSFQIYHCGMSINGMLFKTSTITITAIMAIFRMTSCGDVTN